MRKRIIITMILFMALSLNLVTGQVREEMKEMSLGHRTAFSIELPETGSKVASDIWKEYVKDNYGSKTKWNRKTKELVSEGVDSKSLDTGYGVTFYSTIDEKGDDVILVLWVDQGNAFASSENSGDKDVEKLLLRYALEVAQENIRIELSNEEDVLKKLESQKKKLISAEKKYQKEIERAQENLKKNEKEQGEVMKQIEEQLKKVEKVKNKLSDL